MLHPEKFVALGIDPPKGVLCYGPPGARRRLCPVLGGTARQQQSGSVQGSVTVCLVLLPHGAQCDEAQACA